MALDRHAPAGLLEDQLDGELAWRWRGWTRLDAVVVVAVDGDGMRCAVRVGGTAMVVVVMLWDLTRLLVMSARRLAGVDGLQGHVPAPVGSHGLVIIPVLVVAGRGRARRRGRRASLSLRESLEEKVVVERVRHRGRRRGRLRCMARRHRRVESLEEGAVDLLDLERHLNRPAQPPRQPDDGVVLWGAQLLKLVGKIQQRSSQEFPSNL
jgi:hypothetical protein